MRFMKQARNRVIYSGAGAPEKDREQKPGQKTAKETSTHPARAFSIQFLFVGHRIVSLLCRPATFRKSKAIDSNGTYRLRLRRG